MSVVPDDGFLVASSQGNHTYVVYDRAPPQVYRETFRVGEAGAVAGVEDTDGPHVVSAPLGPRYPMGLLVVQDGINLAWDARVNRTCSTPSTSPFRKIPRESEASVRHGQPRHQARGVHRPATAIQAL